MIEVHPGPVALWDDDPLMTYSGADYQAVPYLEDPISYQEFFTDFLARNRPCLLGAWATESWPVRKELGGEEGPRVDALAELAGREARVPVTNCSARYFNSQECGEESLGDYLAYWAGPREELRYLKAGLNIC
jgi:hypothetical protein